MVVETAPVGLCKTQKQTKGNEHGKEIGPEKGGTCKGGEKYDGERVTRKHETHEHVWIYSTRHEIFSCGAASNPIRKELFPSVLAAFPCALVLFHLTVLFEMTVDSS